MSRVYCITVVPLLNGRNVDASYIVGHVEGGLRPYASRNETTGDANCSSSSSSSSSSISSVPGRSLRNAAGRFRSFASLAVDRSSVWLLTLCTLKDPDSGTGLRV